MTKLTNLALAGVLCGAGLGFAACSSDDDNTPTPGGGNDAGAGVASNPDSGKPDLATKPDAGVNVDSPANLDATPGDAAEDVSDDGAADAAASIAMSSGAFVKFDNPFGDGSPNPAQNIAGSARADDAGGGTMTVWLNVTGMPPAMKFGAHLHKLDCADMMAGGHYQNNEAPAGLASDPAYGNPTNEVWLDFMTDATGAGSGTTTVNWKPRAGAAKSIVVHAMMTGDGGVAGKKLACLPMTFK